MVTSTRAMRTSTSTGSEVTLAARADYWRTSGAQVLRL